jgi:hypothetical protein
LKTAEKQSVALGAAKDALGRAKVSTAVSREALAGLIAKASVAGNAIDVAVRDGVSVEALAKLCEGRITIKSEIDEARAEVARRERAEVLFSRRHELLTAIDQKASLEARCAAFVGVWLVEYPPAAESIPALMAGNMRLAAAVEKIAARQDEAFAIHARDFLVSEGFRSQLRLPTFKADNGIVGHF